MYALIAENYEKIFPLKEPMKKFTLENVTADTKALDIGCATGALLEGIHKHISYGVGLEPSTHLLEKARAKNLHQIRWTQGIMQELADNLKEEPKFNLVTIFGNTLVHLSSLSEVEKDFISLSKIIALKAKLYPILNYHKILIEKPAELEPIYFDNYNLATLFLSRHKNYLNRNQTYNRKKKEQSTYYNRLQELITQFDHTIMSKAYGDFLRTPFDPQTQTP